MDEAKEMPSTSKTKKKAGKAIRSKTKRAGRREPASEDGAERLRRAADKRVGEISGRLADLIAKKALGGDLAYFKWLMGLAQGKMPTPESVKRRSLPSLATVLTGAPQWEGEREEGLAETGYGGVETEL